MCGRYTAPAAQEVIEDYFGAEFSDTHIPVFNASPGQHLPVVLSIAPGFYEWKARKEGKQPYRIVLKTGEPFAFAGIWREVAGEPAYVILTTDANKVTQPIHDRMPVILERGERVLWLDHELPAEWALKLLAPYPDDAMTAYRVSRPPMTPEMSAKR